MANSFTTQVLEDGSRNAVVKLTGVLDTSDLGSTIAVDVSTLTGEFAAAEVRINFVDYSISDQLSVQLLWDATADVVILPLSGSGRMCFTNFGGLTNNSGAGKTGDINILTTGWTSGTQVFSIVLEMVKQA